MDALIGNLKMKSLVSCELVWDGTTPRQQSVSSGTRVSPVQLARTGELSRLARWVRGARGPGLAMNLSGASPEPLSVAGAITSGHMSRGLTLSHLGSGLYTQRQAQAESRYWRERAGDSSQPVHCPAA